MKVSTMYFVLVAAVAVMTSNAKAQDADALLLAQEYARCAAYYLMMSKADVKLQKLAPIGIAAADQTVALSDQKTAIDMMGTATREMLASMDNDWGNAGVVIERKAVFCKALMTMLE